MKTIRKIGRFEGQNAKTIPQCLYCQSFVRNAHVAYVDAKQAADVYLMARLHSRDCHAVLVAVGTFTPPEEGEANGRS